MLSGVWERGGQISVLCEVQLDTTDHEIREPEMCWKGDQPARCTMRYGRGCLIHPREVFQVGALVA